jgi:hypothetical protein
MNQLRKNVGRAAALAALVTLFSAGAQADGPQAVAAAAQHAGLAANQGAIGGVRTHLHHTLNCLVGPDGEGFDASAGNPCQAAGGAIPQTAAGEMRDKLIELADDVRSAIATDDLAAAKEAAGTIQEMLAAD